LLVAVLPPKLEGTAEAMTAAPPSRRPFLRSLGLLALGTLTAPWATRPAGAFQYLPDSDYRHLVDSACGASADHQRQLAEAAARLGVDARAPEAQALLKQLTCPICGCPLAAAAPTAEQPNAEQPAAEPALSTPVPAAPSTTPKG